MINYIEDLSPEQLNVVESDAHIVISVELVLKPKFINGFMNISRLFVVDYKECLEALETIPSRLTLTSRLLQTIFGDS